MEPFDSAAADVFADREIAEDATYNGLPVRVIVSRGDINARLFVAGARVTGHRIDVPFASVAQPAENDSVILIASGRTFIVRSFQRDRLRLTWRLDVDEI